MILQDYARHIQDRETDVRRILDHFTCTIVLFYDILFYFGVYKVFDLFSDVAEKKLCGSEKREKNKMKS